VPGCDALFKKAWRVVSVAQAYNPNCSGGRGEEDQGLKPAGANSL
jgi:hypothetical protein